MQQTRSEIVARHVSSEIRLDAANSADQWQSTQPVRFCEDWQGKNPDPALETEVRVLWSPASLFLKFVCRYRELFVFEDSHPSGRQDHLWDRDVAEAFLQPGVGPQSNRVAPDVPVWGGANEGVRPYMLYKEVEIAPDGLWVGLDGSCFGLAGLQRG